jgi:hypothetical protein
VFIKVFWLLLEYWMTFHMMVLDIWMPSIDRNLCSQGVSLPVGSGLVKTFHPEPDFPFVC